VITSVWNVPTKQVYELRACTKGNKYSRSIVSRSKLNLKSDDTRAETRIRLSAKRTSPFKTVGASVESTTCSRGVRIRGSNAGYTMFRSSVKGTSYPFYSPVSPSLTLPCVNVCNYISTGVYYIFHNVICTVRVYQITVNRLIQKCALTYTVKLNSEMFRWRLPLPSSGKTMPQTKQHSNNFVWRRSFFIVIYYIFSISFRFSPLLSADLCWASSKQKNGAWKWFRLLQVW